MGLTVQSTSAKASRNFRFADSEILVALAGNPNVGKSTVFNELTGMNQHTGNWPGNDRQRIHLFSKTRCNDRGLRRDGAAKEPQPRPSNSPDDRERRRLC